MKRVVYGMVMGLLVGCFACGNNVSEVTGMATEGQLIFRSGFEPETVVVPGTGSDDDIIGVDQSVGPPNDWVGDLEGYPQFGSFRIQYQGGTPEDRTARIVPDPTDPANHVLHYWLKNPRTPAGPDNFKGRIQANVYGNTDLTEVYQKRRLYLHPDMDLLRQYPEGFSWLTLEELWLAAGWINHPFPFRISLHLNKDAGVGMPLYFYVHGQMRDMERDRWKHPMLWESANRDFEVPIATWMTLETYYRQGDGQSGRFFLAVQPEGGPRQVIFDLTAWTYSPDATEPIPMTHWNPLKMYTSGKLVDYVRDAGGVLQLYYDDLEIWSSWPDGANPSGP